MELDEFKCPLDTKVSVSQERIISNTKVNGLRGTVKETSGLNDWSIDIEFLFIDSDVKEVYKQIDKLKSIWNKQEAIEITNKKLGKLGITHCVLTRLEFPNEDRLFELPVRITALSDDIDYDPEEPDSGEEE